MESIINIKDWVDNLQRNGKLFFSFEQATTAFPGLQPAGIRNGLARLSAKGSIISVWKGFYVIVPIAYSVNGILPPIMYVDHLMQHLQRMYYVGLLNAAAFYGSALQQPQVLSVIIQHPTLRDSSKKNIKLQFVCRRKFPPEDLLETRKTQTGYVKISNAILTAADIVYYEKEIGGLNRACTVLNDLVDEMNFSTLYLSFFEVIPTSTIQRLGYLLDKVILREDLANSLYERAIQARCTFQSISLKNRKSTENCIQDKKWKVIINTDIEIDE